MNKSLLYCLSFSVIFSLTFLSCVNIQRDIKINKDGSGTERISMNLGKEYFDYLSSMIPEKNGNFRYVLDSLYKSDFLKDLAKKDYTDKEGVNFIDAKSEVENDSSLTTIIEYKFDNVKYIDNSLQPIGSKSGTDSKRTKTVVFFKEEGSKVIFRYNFIRNNNIDSTYNIDLSDYFKNDKITVNIEFPYDVITSNANYTDGRKLTWEIPVNYFLEKNKKFSLKAEMKK